MSKSQIENRKSEMTDDAAEIAACKAAMLPLARISPKGDRMASDPEAKDEHGNLKGAQFTGVYLINRCGQQRQITAADIEAARACVENPAATLADCRKALRPLARLPQDFRIEDRNAALYVFPGDGGEPVPITNAIIGRAQELTE